MSITQYPNFDPDVNVQLLNNLSGSVAITEGPYIDVATQQSNNTIEITNIGTQLLNNLSGIITLAPGTNITLGVDQSNNTITINSTGGGGGGGGGGSSVSLGGTSIDAFLFNEEFLGYEQQTINSQLYGITPQNVWAIEGANEAIKYVDNATGGTFILQQYDENENYGYYKHTSRTFSTVTGSADDVYTISTSNNPDLVIVGSGSGGSGTSQVAAGLMREVPTTAGTETSNGIFFRASAANSNWIGVCRASGSETTINMGVSRSSEQVLRATVKNQGASVDFYANGNFVGTITTNIPTALLRPMFGFIFDGSLSSRPTLALNAIRCVQMDSTSVSSGNPASDIQFIVLSGSTSLSNERILSAGPFINISDQGPNNLVVISGTGVQLLNNESGIVNLVAGPNITIIPRSDNNTIEISGVGGGGGGGGVNDATYVVMSSNPSLTDERVLTAGSYINIQDNGANSTVVISGTGVQLLNNMSGLVSLVAGPNITITPRSDNNTIEISGTGGGDSSGSSSTVAVRVKRTSDQTLSNGYTTLSWQSAVYNYGNLWSISNPTKFIVDNDQDGIYTIGLHIDIQPNGTGRRMAAIEVNGVLISQESKLNSNGTYNERLETTTEYWLSSGNEVKFFAYHDAGTDLLTDVTGTVSAWMSRKSGGSGVSYNVNAITSGVTIIGNPDINVNTYPNNIIAISGNHIYCQALYTGSDISVSHDTSTYVGLNSVVRAIDPTMLDNGRIMIKQDGFYHVNALVDWIDTAGSNEYDNMRLTSIRGNRSSVLGSNAGHTTKSANSNILVHNPNGVHYLTSGTAVELQLYQNSGGSRTARALSYAPTLTVKSA